MWDSIGRVCEIQIVGLTGSTVGVHLPRSSVDSEVRVTL